MIMSLINIEKTTKEPTNSVYEHVIAFKKKYPGTIAWRLKKHCSIIDKHLNPGEEVLFAFSAQYNISFTDIFNTCVLCLTNKRLLIGQKHLIVGYTLKSITPDLFNDLEVNQGLLWGGITIDTVKEVVNISNIAKKALPEIETSITEYMMNEKKKYPERKEA